MFMKFDIVFRDNYKESFFREFNLSKFKDFLVIVIHLTCKCERGHINNIDFRVFTGKDSTNLCVFSMFKLFH